jgi:hypothetical protein
LGLNKDRESTPVVARLGHYKPVDCRDQILRLSIIAELKEIERGAALHAAAVKGEFGEGLGLRGL